MHFEDLLTEQAVLSELGQRLARHRRERNWTQAQAASEAGIGQATLQRAERGESVQMTSMIKLMRALGLLGGLDVAVPESIELPIARLERERRAPVRRRVRHGRTVRSKGSPASRSHVESPSGQNPVESASGREPAEWSSDPESVGSVPEPVERPPGPESGGQAWRWGDDLDGVR